MWIHLREECFPSKGNSKLMLKADGPFEVLERVNDSAYKINLPRDNGVSATFNVADLSSYLEDDHLVNLRANFFQQGEDDGALTILHDLGPQVSQVSSSPSTNSQVVIHALFKQSYDLLGYDPLHRPGFVHLIS